MGRSPRAGARGEGILALSDVLRDPLIDAFVGATNALAAALEWAGMQADAAVDAALYGTAAVSYGALVGSVRVAFGRAFEVRLRCARTATTRLVRALSRAVEEDQYLH